MRRALVPAALGILLLSSTLNTGCSGGSSTPVPPPPKTLVSIAVTPVSPSIVNGTTQQFTATGNYSEGTTQNVTTSATWSSSDPTVATISSQGLATGLKAGSVTITALLDTKSGTDDLSVTSAAVPPSWAQHGPTARNSHSSVFDPASKQMIVFGGQDTASGAALNDLWLVGTGVDRHLSASSITPTNGGPSARYGHTATYDAANDRMTIFAGGSGSPLTCTNDVWVLDGATSQNGDPTWIHLTPSGGPAPRMRHNAVYDSTTNSLIVFGGSDCAGGDLNDVWVLSNANGNGGTPAWTKVTTTGPPPAPREGSSAIYDATNNVLTIYGGSSGAFIFGDILTLSNANGSGTAEWNPLLPSGVGPLGRKGHSALYDSVNNLMIVFGGVSGSTTFGDTWVLTSPNGIGGAPLWTKITATGTAPTLYFHGAAYDDAANAMYLFGGTATTSKLEISNHTFVLSKANGLTSGSNWTVSGPPVRYSQSAFVDSSNLFVF